MIRLINEEKPFMITRIGIGAETQTAVDLTIGRTPSKGTIGILENNAGVYNMSGKRVIKFSKLYTEAIKNSTAIAVFPDSIVEQQKMFVDRFKLKTLHNRVVEPFHCCLIDIKPWTLHLKKKKVLIVNPFVKSMKKQLDSGFKFFKDKDIFPEDVEFIFYKSFQSVSGNKPHSDWFMTFKIMCNDIKRLDFDIALLGCGGYGLPLCNFIYKDMGKSSVYVGGGLQLLFGVMGQRWVEQSDGLWPRIAKENGCKFIRPSGDEIPQNIERVEGGCYW